MRSYHHNPYRQSSASYEPHPVLQQRVAARAATQPPLPPPLRQADSRAQGAAPQHGTAAPAHPPTAVAHVPQDARADGAATRTPSHTFCAADPRPHRAPFSPPLVGGDGRHPLPTSPPPAMLLSGECAGGGGGGATPTAFTPTQLSSAPPLSRRTAVQLQSPEHTSAVERRSFSDWGGAAPRDDPSVGGSWVSGGSVSPAGPANVCSHLAHTTAVTPISPVDTVATTLFIDGLPPSIENKWQLQPYVPPHGLAVLRAKTSRGRSVGFAVYESIAAARDALTWFKQMRIFKEVVQTSNFGAPHAADTARWAEGDGPRRLSSGAWVDGATCGPGDSAAALPMAYEEYVNTHHSPVEFAALLRTCTLLRVEWARSVETQHTHGSGSDAVATGPPAASVVSPSTSSYPPSPWGAAAVAAPRHPPPVMLMSAGPHDHREANHGSRGGSSLVPELPQHASQHPQRSWLQPGMSWSSPQSPQKPVDAASVTADWGGFPISPPLPPRQPSAPVTPHYGPSPVAHRDWPATAPSAMLPPPPPPEPQRFSGVAALEHHPSHMHDPQRSAAHDAVPPRLGPLRGVPPDVPAPCDRAEEILMPMPMPMPTAMAPPAPMLSHHALQVHRQPSATREPPLPCRTLFVRLIHNFDSPEYLPHSHHVHQHDQHDQFRVDVVCDGDGGDGAVAAAGLRSPGTAVAWRSLEGAGAAAAPTRLSSQTSPWSPTLGGDAAAAGGGNTGARPRVAVVPHYCLHHQSHELPLSPTTAATEHQSADASLPPPPLLTVVRDREGDTVCRPPPTAEDRQFFCLAQSVLREEYFSEKFAGVLRFSEFLRPPYYGGCFVLFERGEDMQRCLQWMRKDERLMKLFAVAPARNDTFGT